MKNIEERSVGRERSKDHVTQFANKQKEKEKNSRDHVAQFVNKQNRKGKNQGIMSHCLQIRIRKGHRKGSKDHVT